MRDRLIELIKSKSCQFYHCPDNGCEECDHIELYNDDIENMADFILADGWIRPPCKVGDKVYIVRNGRVNEVWVRCTKRSEVSGMVDSFMFTVFYKLSPTSFTETLKFGESEIGINVFLTKEEAEQALKGGVQE